MEGGTMGVIVGCAYSIFAPVNWHFCDGRRLSIRRHSALFSIMGSNYGGDDRTFFNVPDLRGRSLMGIGNGPNLSERTIGKKGGDELVSLQAHQIPAHTHTATPTFSYAINGRVDPRNMMPTDFGQPIYGLPGAGNMAVAHVANTGGGVPHNNMMPYLAISWILCTVGMYPSRSG